VNLAQEFVVHVHVPYGFALDRWRIEEMLEKIRLNGGKRFPAIGP